MSESLQIVCPHCNATNRLPAEKLGARGTCGRCKRPLFDGQPIALTRDNIQPQLHNGDLPVVVDFWAPWCGPCRAFAPAFEQAATQLEPYARLAKLNTEEEQALAAQFGIRSIPTLIAFKRGKELARQSGAMDQGSFVRWVRSIR